MRLQPFCTGLADCRKIVRLCNQPGFRVKFIQQNRTLSFAIALSVLVHGVLLSVRFISPETFRLPPANPALEVVLVNARHSKSPLNPEALAQADLDGGGNADAGRAKSPLPDMGRSQDGDSLKVSRKRIAELQEQQRQMMTQMKPGGALGAQRKASKKTADATAPGGADATDSTRMIARMAAEISRTVDDQNRRPKKTFISPSTRGVGYAMYYKTLQKRIEEIGTLNFPQDGTRKLYGELTISIPIFHDGTLYKKDGGPKVERSSGIAALDRAAIRIVERAAPFGRFPKNMRRTDGGDDLWVVITRFKFTREQALEAQMQGAN